MRGLFFPLVDLQSRSRQRTQLARVCRHSPEDILKNYNDLFVFLP